MNIYSIERPVKSIGIIRNALGVAENVEIIPKLSRQGSLFRKESKGRRLGYKIRSQVA